MKVNEQKRKEELAYLQSLPLSMKVSIAKDRIREFVNEYGTDGVYVAYSGGKDSKVLLHIVRSMYPSIKAMYVNTGLEYMEVRKLVERTDNCDIEQPAMNMYRVLDTYGYPIISKEVSECIQNARLCLESNGQKYISFLEKINGVHKNPDGTLSSYNYGQYLWLMDAPFAISPTCCKKLKKEPAINYEKKHNLHPIIGTMADESRLRKSEWIKHSCNTFDGDRPKCKPLSIFMQQDILQYIKLHQIEIASVYGDIVYVDKDGFEYPMVLDPGSCKLKTTGCERTGCVFCLFGITSDKERLVRLKELEPKRYDYVMNGGEFNEQGIWHPNKKGLGYRFVIDWLNEHGNLEIQY